MGLEAIREAYGLAAGAWTGCDWPTRFGKTGLNLQGWTACQAKRMAAEAGCDPCLGADWSAAAGWLAEVECQAEQAEVQAAIALAAASAGEFAEALEHARRGLALEQQSGRPTTEAGRRGWAQLVQAIERSWDATANGKPAKSPDAASRVESKLAKLEAEHLKLLKRLERLERVGVLV